MMCISHASVSTPAAAALARAAARRLARAVPCRSDVAADVHPPVRGCRACCSAAAATDTNTSGLEESLTGASARDVQQQHLPHVSVLLEEVCASLNHAPLRVFVDCTLGAGGHSEAMLRRHPVRRVHA
jgi:MraW methylase family